MLELQAACNNPLQVHVQVVRRSVSDFAALHGLQQPHPLSPLHLVISCSPRASSCITGATQCHMHLLRRILVKVQAGEEPVRPAVADEHALMVARLRHEREAREALVRQLDGLRAQKVRRDRDHA